MEEAGKLILAGFELEPAEKAIADNVIKSYEHKIRERIAYDYISLRLRKNARGKGFLHEIEGKLKARNALMTSQATDYNLFAAIADTMEKLLNELVHKQRTSRQRK